MQRPMINSTHNDRDIFVYNVDFFVVFGVYLR